MSAPEFLDSNVLIYAYDLTDLDKRRIARSIVRRAIAGEVILSTQVLAEFAAIMIKKINPTGGVDPILAALNALSSAKVVLPDEDTVRRALEVHTRYGLRFYDGMIVAAAERAGCTRIWSEDMNSGQQYFGIEIANPFHKH